MSKPREYALPMPDLTEDGCGNKTHYHEADVIAMRERYEALLQEEREKAVGKEISLSDLTHTEVYSGVPVKDIKAVLEALAQRGFRVVKG